MIPTFFLNNDEPFLIDDLIDFVIDKLQTHKEYIFLLDNIPLHSHNIVKLVPPVSSLLFDTSKKIQNIANKLIEKIVCTNENKDLEPFIPLLLESFKDASKSKDAIEAIASCVFVQNVKSSTLSLMTPILKKGLQHKKYEIQRKTCVIIDNICKLVDDPSEIYSFVPEIYPLVKKCSQEISHPEVRNIADNACKTIEDIYDKNAVSPYKSIADIRALFDELNIPINEDESIIFMITKNLYNRKEFNEKIWKNLYDKYLEHSHIWEKVYHYLKKSTTIGLYHEDQDEGEDLYKGELSLAYGTITLLRNTFLHLKRNRFYGLLGPNNCGKTTLMRAIYNEQVEGFPKKDVLKTVFVEHEIQEKEIGEDEHHYPIYNTDLSGIDWILDYTSNKISKDEVRKVMADIGFGNERAADMDMPVTSYSGGWKMKMQLCAASLINADILMLDEPTGHLDVTNIEWLKNWLREFMNKGGSIITTSHDSQFLNEMVTHIIDFHKKKLVLFKGSLHEFVDKYHDKKGYFELKNDIVRFEFPEPGILENVKSLSKSVLKMNNVCFTYPTRTKPTVMNINLECSRISRVAVIGPNGAGKSTAIKLLINELQPSSGTIQKHPNLRMAYVAQHAFFHLEKHLNKTPTEYIMWRFAGNEDKESLEFINNQKLASDRKKIKKFCFDKHYNLRECQTIEEEKNALEVEYIISKHENKKEKKKEYEVKWKNKSSDVTTWVDRDVLFDMGAEKMVQSFDEKEAITQGFMNKPLTSKVIEKHFMQFGIQSEFASHTLIGSLSGGQKIKVVLAAALWQNPHIIILDEPTNYLDRDSLGALVVAIQNYKGGVIIISHNREFANAVCQEKWIMEGGMLRKEGESIDKSKDQNDIIDKKESIIDSFGNEIKIQKKKTWSQREKSKEIKRLKKLLNEAKKNNHDAKILEYEDLLEELNNIPNE